MYSSNNPIRSIEYHSVSGGVDDSFVGLKYDGNQIHIYHPECYCIAKDSPETRNDILSLLRTISIAKTTSHEHSKAYNTQNDGGEFALFSYLWLIKDYMSNGIYVNREKTYKVNQPGKINWKRTLQTEPIVSGKNIVFTNIIVENKSNIDNILVEAHKLCVKKSIDYIGWLFNLNSDFITVPKVTDALINEYRIAVQNEMNKTFLDNKRLLLRNMKNVLEGLDERSNNKEFVYGVDSYYYIFERMIDSIFGNVDRIRDYYPSAEWHLVKNEYHGKNASKLRPDTIILLDDGNNKFNAYILDSKFYRFGYTGDENDLPETTSIQKQITYGEYIKKNIKRPIANVYNAFILPYDKTRDKFKSNDNLQYIGFAKSTWKDNKDSHELIHAFLIDLKYVIHEWNRNNHDVVVSNLINLINEKQDIAKQLLK